MKKLFRLFALPLVLALALTGCKDDDNNPFAGSDHHIVAFTLTAHGVEYRAAISGDRITLTVPVGVDLTGAAVSYELCEQATIKPDPASITDWNSDQAFRVTSYNQSSGSYTYTVSRSQVVSSGNVTLLTQADVDAFAASGATVVDGNLTIGTAGATSPFDTIRDLSALSGLTEVRYNLTINNTFGGKSLAGLDNLTRVGGLYVGSVLTAGSTYDSLELSLPGLVSAGDMVVNNDKVKSFSAPKLVSAGSLNINSKGLAVLRLDALAACAGDLSIQSLPVGVNPSSSNINNALQSLSFPALTDVSGSLMLNNFGSVTTVGLPRLAYVGGNFAVRYLSRLGTLELPELATLNGGVTLYYLSALETFKAPRITAIGSFNSEIGYNATATLATLDLGKLSTVTGNFQIKGAALETLALPALQTVGGTLTLYQLQSLTAFDVPALAGCGAIVFQSLNLLAEVNLSGLASLDNLESVSCYALGTIRCPKTVGDIKLNGGSRLCDFPELIGIEEVTGTLKVTNYTKNVDIVIPHVRRIGTFSMTESGPKELTYAFPDLAWVGSFEFGSYNCEMIDAPKLAEAGRLAFSSPWALLDIRLPELRKIGELSLTNGSWNADRCQITNLDAFKEVTSIGKVTIEYCGNLADFSGLEKALPTLTADNWSVEGCKYSPTFQNMLDGKFTGAPAE